MKKKKFTVDKMTFVAFTIIPLILYTFFYFISVSCGIYYSLTDWNGLNREYNFVGIANYIALSKNVFMWRSLWRTLLYACMLVGEYPKVCVNLQTACMLVVCVTVLSLIIALVLNSVKKCRVFVKSVFFFPAMLGSVAVALIWDQMFYQLLPAVGKMMGVNLQTPLADPSTAIFGVLFVNVWQAVAMPTIILLAGLQSIPDDLYESAMIDGVSRWQNFRYITLPFLVPTMTVNMVLNLKAGITTFDYAFALTGGGPNRATEFIGLMIYNDGFKDSNFAVANAKAVVLALIIAILSFIQIRQSQKHEIN